MDFKLSNPSRVFRLPGCHPKPNLTAHCVHRGARILGDIDSFFRG